MLEVSAPALSSEPLLWECSDCSARWHHWDATSPLRRPAGVVLERQCGQPFWPSVGDHSDELPAVLASGYSGWPHPGPVPEHARRGVFAHSFCCHQCGLKFVLFSWLPGRHRVGHVTCPECAMPTPMTHWITTLSTRRDADWDATHPEIFHFVPVGDAHVAADSVAESLTGHSDAITEVGGGGVVQMTQEQFDVVYDALAMANHPYTNEDVPSLVAKESQAWEVLQQVKSRHHR